MGLNKAQLVDAIASSAGLTKVDAEKALKGTMDAIATELVTGGNVTLVGFGTFSVAAREARNGKNPQTGATIKIPAKKVAKFKPGKALAESVNVTGKKKPAAAPKAAAKPAAKAAPKAAAKPAAKAKGKKK